MRRSHSLRHQWDDLLNHIYKTNVKLRCMQSLEYIIMHEIVQCMYSLDNMYNIVIRLSMHNTSIQCYSGTFQQLNVLMIFLDIIL